MLQGSVSATGGCKCYRRVVVLQEGVSTTGGYKCYRSSTRFMLLILNEVLMDCVYTSV